MPDILETATENAPALSETSPAYATPEPAPAEPAAEAEAPVDPKIGAALEEAGVELPDQSPPQPQEAEAEPEATPAPKPPRNKYSESLDRLTKQRDDTAAELAKATAELAKATEVIRQVALERQQQHQPPAPQQPVELPELPRPKRADFADPDAYDDALVAYTEARAEQRVMQRLATEQAERQQQEAIQRNQRDAEQYRTTVQQRLVQLGERGAEKHADFHEKIQANGEMPMTMPMLNAIANLPNGEDVMYYLADNPTEATRLAGITVPNQFLPMKLPNGEDNPFGGQPLPDFPQQTIEIGRIAERLASAANAPPPVSRAPAPITPVRSNASASPRNMAEVGSQEGQGMEEYAAMRNRQIADERASRGQPKFGRAN